MVVEPKFRNNVCMTAHPAGCALQVKEQIDYVKSRDRIKGPENVLVVGSSNGYGLASRIVAAFGCGSKTAGVSLERPSKGSRTGTAGWYNDLAFRQEAHSVGVGGWTVNGDAFSDEIKDQTVSLIGDKLGKVDLFIYSIASPRRINPVSGEIYSSVIKPIGKIFTSKTLDFLTGLLSEIEALPASDSEIEQTVKVMGGEDWNRWVEALSDADMIADNALTVAFSYVGPQFTYPIYREGTIGKAKEHLESTAVKINQKLASRKGKAFISINKALVTRASAVVPAFPLYLAVLYGVMKKKGIHEGCIQQMYRLFNDFLYTENPRPLDERGRIRLDNLEMRADVQREVVSLLEKVSSENIDELSDLNGFREEYLRHHGFGMEGVDYEADVDI
jgi:enoyl-[acyl-carrier protein] reductase/trans-2-enoyl-CoA reductase (NAD+)